MRIFLAGQHRGFRFGGDFTGRLSIITSEAWYPGRFLTSYWNLPAFHALRLANGKHAPLASANKKEKPPPVGRIFQPAIAAGNIRLPKKVIKNYRLTIKNDLL